MARIGVRLDAGSGLSPHDMVDLASLAETRGYDTIWIPEGAAGDAPTQLAATAVATQRIALCTGILPIFHRTPTLLAMTAGNLDAIAKGRFILGLGVGHQRATEQGHGVEFTRPMARIRETVEIVRRLLRGKRVTYEGRCFQLREASLGFTPLRPDLPIYLAALGPRMIELAGEIADGVLLNWAWPDYIPQAIQCLRRGAERVGRDPEEIDVACYIRTAVVDDPDVVRPSLQRQIARYGAMPFYRRYLEQSRFKEETVAISRALDMGDTDAAAAAVSDAMQRELAIFGPAEHCRQEVERRRSLGLKLPVIAPFAVADDPLGSFRATIEAFSG